jgi:DNA (cytosine-5)-methyltransferase 1
MTLRLLDLFSGIGGFSYAAEVLVGGFRTVAFCDIEPYAQEVLKRRWPGVPVHTDVRELRGTPGEVDVITAGFPCQDLSQAGKRLGFAGDRSVLFYEVIRLAREFRPQFLLLENVRGLLSHANGETFQEVLFQIAQAGFDAEWAVIPASDVGACHRRDRWWCVAYAQGERWGTGPGQGASQTGYQGPRAGDGAQGFPADATDMLSHGSASEQQRQPRGGAVPQSGDGHWPDAADPNHQGLEGRLSASLRERPQQRPAWPRNTHCLSPDWRSYLSKPVLRRGDDGLSGRVDRLKALGNGVVPQVAAVPLRRIKDIYLTASPSYDITD